VGDTSEFDALVVKSFGGGLNISDNPAFIRDDQWTWCENVYAKNGVCESARPFERVIASIDAALNTPLFLGAFPDPVDPEKILVACSAVHEGSRDYGFHLYKIDTADPGGVAVTEVLPTDIRPACSNHPARSAVLNGKHMMTTGLEANATCKCSLIRVDSALDTYTVIVTPGTAIADGAFESFFDGAGLNDFDTNHAATGYTNTIGEVYTVRISATGTPDAFKWKRRGQAEGAPINITGALQTLEFGVQIKFTATTGHTLNDEWHFCVGSSLQAQFMLSFGGHLILGFCDRSSGVNWNTFRTVAWSAANDPETWQPALSNDADDFILDDSASPITGLAELSGNRVGIYTDDRTYTLTPTSRIPAFTRSTLAPRIGVAATGRRSSTGQYEPSLLVATPGGLVVSTKDSIAVSFAGEQRIVDQPVHDYIYQKFSGASGKPVDYAIWNQEHRQVLIPTNDDEIMTLETATGAWGRLDLTNLGAGVNAPQQLDCIADIQGETGKVSELWVLFFNRLHREYDNDQQLPADVAWVDTKDFHVGSDVIEIRKIFIDWEGLCDAFQNELEVLHESRDRFSPGPQGEHNRRLDPDITFATLGTLIHGYTNELDVSLVGRYHRFRFRQSAGRFRIRGFKLLWRRGSDR
jgi:hypothetical protein